MEIKWKEIIQFKWFKRLHILYVFGFIMNFRPASPFFYEFLITDDNFSKNETSADILPVWFYTSSAASLPVFLLMDFFKYNPFLIISTLTGIVATSLYIWTKTLTELQVAQAFNACVASTELAYYVSIYAHGDLTNFQRLTSYVRTAPLVGKAIATFLAQLFYSQGWLTSKELHYFNLAAFILATITTIFLPVAEPQKNEKSEKLDEKPSRFISIFSNLTEIFPNKYVVKWSLWSVLTFCGYYQFSVYVQPLWKNLQETHGTFIYNGVLEGLYALFAVGGTVLGGFAKFDWKFKGDLILSMTSLVEGFLLILMSQIENVALNCTFYVFLGFMFHFIVTIVCGEIAKFLKNGCYGLLFGLIALAASVLSSIMVCFLNDRTATSLELGRLFMAYGFYHLGISVLFIVIGLSYWFAKHTYQ